MDKGCEVKERTDYAGLRKKSQEFEICDPNYLMFSSGGTYITNVLDLQTNGSYH